MAVSSIKAGWSKLSARIRDYIDVMDSHYRGEDVIDAAPRGVLDDDGDHLRHHHTRHCSKHKPTKHLTVSLTTSTKDKRIGASNKSPACLPSHLQHQQQAQHHHHHHHHHHHNHHNHSYPHARNQLHASQQLHQQLEQQTRMSYERPARQTSVSGGRGAVASGTQSLSPNSTTISSTSSRLASQQGYVKRKTPQGQVYFVDQVSGRKTWYDPTVPKELLNAKLDLDLLVGPLDANWQLSQTSNGKIYYINHIKQSTQFTDPRLVAHKDMLMGLLRSLSMSNGAQSSEVSSESCKGTGQYANKKELQDKISILRQELLKQQVLTHPCKIDINRKRIFEESFRAVSQMPARDLKKRLLIKFRGEEGLDYGGVAREWFYLLSREILNPVHGLFQYTSDDDYNLQINPDSGIVYREHLAYMNFCGRIMGMAIFHGHFIEGRFSLPLYKMLLKKPITLSDIESVDPDLYRSLNWILDNDITDVIDTTFLVHHNAFGQLQEHELKPNGRNITVSEANKHEYVSLYVNYRCRRGIESQFTAIQRGFHELIHPSLLENFDEHELELLIGGLTKLNIDDWRLHTKLKNCHVDTPLVIWFWDIVKSYDEDKRARLLQFVTGSPRVPIQGFKALQGVNSELRLFTIHMIRNGSTDNLPKSHTCFNRLDLPPYETYDKLRDKLTQAIEETIGFAMQ